MGCVLVFFLPMIDDNNGKGVVLLNLLIYFQPHTAQGQEYQQDPGVAVLPLILPLSNNN
jgi:hypothetical protein